MNRNNLLLILIGLFFFNCDITNTESSLNIEPNIQYNTELSIHKENELIYIEIYDYPEIAGFQFELSTNGDLQINSLTTFGGAADENNFTVSTGLANLIVLGFNFNGETIESSHLTSNILLYLDIETEGSGSIGIDNVILSGENGYNIPIQVESSLISIP